MISAAQEIALTVNGIACRTRAISRTLQEMLAIELGHTEVRRGCGEGACGVCLVLRDGAPVLSCLQPAAAADRSSLVTANGLGDIAGHSREKHAALLDNLLERGAFQCGYCAPGMLVAAAHLLATESDLDERRVRTALSGNLCRCSGYTAIVDAILATHRGAVARSTGRRDDLRGKLNGSLAYPTDPIAARPGRAPALLGGILFSAHPAAEILSIDVAAAVALPGVHVVLTHRDLPGRNVGGVDAFMADQPILAEGRVRSMSDAVALVAAESEAALAAALAAIEIAYRVDTPVLTLDEALANERAVISGRSNVIAQFNHRTADFAAAFANADVIVEDLYECGPADHVCLELDGGAALWDGDVLTLRLPTQSPHLARATVARALSCAEDRIRIDAPRAGGSFGRHLVAGFECQLAVLAMRAGRDIRLVLSRRDALARGPKRNAFQGRYRLAIRGRRFTGLEADILVDSGPYVSVTPSMVSLLASEAAGAYDIAAQRIVARGVRTNNLVTAPMRGYGSLQVGFAIERLVDAAARRLGVDPAELRRINFKTHRSDGHGRPVDGGAPLLAETLATALRRLGERPAAPAGWRVGRGQAVIHAKYGYPYGLVDRVAVKVSVGADGAFLVSSDVSDSGTGVAAMIGRRVAERLGLTAIPRYGFAAALVEDPTGIAFATGHRASAFRARMFKLIEFVATTLVGGALVRLAPLRPDTYARLLRLSAPLINGGYRVLMAAKAALFPIARDIASPTISGSRSLFQLGAAARDAADAFARRALERAAQSFGCPVTDLRINETGIASLVEPALRITWTELAVEAGGEISAIGTAALPPGRLLDPATGNQTGPADFMDATHACDVAVHPKTGEVRIVGYVAVHDVGRVFDREIVEGQIRGGLIMGLSLGVGEALDIEGGRVATTSLRQLNLPTALDGPESCEIVLVESGLGLGPDGAKGIGEAATVAAPIALASAIADALGAGVTRLPLALRDVSDLVQAQRGEAPSRKEFRHGGR